MTWLRRWDPLTVSGFILLAAIAVYLLLDLNGTSVQWHLFWSVMPILDICVFLIAREVGRRPGLQSAERRLWRALVIEGVVITTGDSVQAALVWTGSTTGLQISPITDLCNLIGLMPVLWVLLTYRTTDEPRSVRGRYLLDSAAVGVGISVVMWFLLASTGTADRNRTALLFGAMILGITAFAACNLVLAGVLPVTRPAAIMVATGALLQTYAAGLLSAGDKTNVALAFMTVTTGLICMGVRIHQIDRDPRLYGGRPRRQYSLLPYGTLVVSFGLLPVAVRSGLGFDFWVVMAGLFATTALVVARQVLAFRENAQLLQQLRHQATHDALTGLANRALFDERMRETTGPAAMLLVDLDGFKGINDGYGHHAGDAVLQAVAERLRRCVPENATAARLGGDEFAVILPGADAAAAQAVADAFLAGLDEPVVVDGTVLQARASVGAAAGMGTDALLRQADEAMYRRKRVRVP